MPPPVMLMNLQGLQMINLDSLTENYNNEVHNVNNIANHENDVTNTHGTLNGMIIDGSQFKIRGNVNTGAQDFKLINL